MQGLRGSGILVAAVLAAAAFASPAGAAEKVPDEVIVQFARDAGAAERADARAETGTSSLEALGAPGAKLLAIEDGGSVAGTIRELEAQPAVARAFPNTLEQPLAAPNDPAFGSLWGMHNFGQTVSGTAGTPDADIDALEAWDIERGNTNTVIAIMDSGADLTHPDIAPVLWQNPGEVPSNGVDDDGNGFVDDFNGYDFVGAEDANPLDGTGHGTHVAGTAAAQGDDGFGVTGVSQRASIMVLRVCTIFGCSIADQIQAINYAGTNGAHVLNGSIGGFSGTENTIRRASIFAHPNTLFVFAAGNDGANADDSPTECVTPVSPCREFPCAHAPAEGETDNTLCVAATTQNDSVPSFSNTGATSVDLGAPGTNVVSDSAERAHFTDTFGTNNFATRWSQNAGDTLNWTRTNEAPLGPNFGITDSPGGNYAPNTTYGTITNAVAVGAVAERGCEVTLRRSIDLLGGNDRFQVALLHNGTVVNQFEFDSGDNSGMITQSRAFTPPPTAGTLQVRLRLVSAADGTQANGVHVDTVVLNCGETPGDHNFESKNGTSMASPHVAGAAGLIRSRNPELTTTEVRALLLGSVDPNPGLTGVTTTGGRLNIGTAIARTPATTAITGGPAEGATIGRRAVRARQGGGPAKGAFPQFTYSSSDPTAGFQCSVDGAAFSGCGRGSQTFGPLAPGPHSVAIRSVDPRGNVDATPAQRSFSVENVPPNTKITKGPKKRTDAEKATFKFKSSEPQSTFQCRIDKKKFKPCRSPKRYKRLDPKKHRFQVRAIDRVGNVDPTAAKKRWQVTG